MLYDHRGNPVRLSALKTTQATPSLREMRSHTTIQSMRGLSALQLARALQAASQGDMSAQALIFEDMEEKDVDILGEMSKRKRAVSGQEWSILPNDDSPRQVELAEFCQQACDNLNMEDLLFDLLDAVGKGVSAVEITWALGSRWLPTKCEHVPLSWLQWGRDAEWQPTTELRLRNATMEGEALTPYKWILHKHKARSGGPYRDALYRVLAWHYLFRNYSLSSWVQFVEGYGIPLRFGRYPAGTSEADQEKLLQAITAIATEAAVVIPEGMTIEVLEAQLRAYSNPHERLLDWTKKEIAIAVCGGTLTSDTSGGGAYALGQVHDGVRRDILESDARQVANTITRQLIRPLINLNFGPQEAYPYFKIELPNPTDLQREAGILQALTSAGFTDIPLWWIRDKFAIPAPTEGEPTLADVLRTAPRPPEPQANRVQANQANRLHMNAAATDARETLDGLADHVTARLQDHAQALVGPVIELLRQANSYEEAYALLEDAFPEMDDAGLTQDLAQAMFLSGLWGDIKA